MTERKFSSFEISNYKLPKQVSNILLNINEILDYVANSF